MEKQIENLSKALEEAIEFVKKEANLAMANKANRDVVDYYDNFALKLKLTLEENRLAPLEIREAQIYISRCESDLGFMGSPDYEAKKKLVKDYYEGRQKPINKLSLFTQYDLDKVRTFLEYMIEQVKDGNEDYELNKFIQTFGSIKKQIEAARWLNSLASNLFWNPETYVPKYLGASDSKNYAENVKDKGIKTRKFTYDFIQQH
jgi:hypothetical protein